MRYFTPERWLRFQDVSDEQAFLAAHKDWEEALAAYRSELTETMQRMPQTLQRFITSESLHDAVLVASWRTPRRLTLLVRPEPPSDRYFLLAYTLAGEPEANPSALPPEHRMEQAIWLYDEVKVEVLLGDQLTPEEVFVHSILLGDGQEMTIRFRRFLFSRRDAVFPRSHVISRQPQPSIPQSA